MSHKDKIIIQGLKQNNLKNVSLEIPKEKIVVFTGVIQFRQIQHCI